MSSNDKPGSDRQDAGNENGNSRGPLVAIGVVVILFVVGWFLARELSASSKLEDCLMSGRTNCAPLSTH